MEINTNHENEQKSIMNIIFSSESIQQHLPMVEKSMEKFNLLVLRLEETRPYLQESGTLLKSRFKQTKM